MERSMKWLFPIILFGLISACSTTPNPDGSTTVRLSLPGLSQPTASQTPQTGQPAVASAQSAPKAQALPPMPGTPISQTPLAGLFQKYPWAGDDKPYYPRVAVTIRDWSRSDCWLADASIWRSPKKSEAVTGFTVCMNGDLGAAINGAAGVHLFFDQSQISNHTGNVRTSGPNPPMMAYLDGAPNPQLHTTFVQQLVQQTGWQPVPGQVTMWIVGFKK